MCGTIQAMTTQAEIDILSLSKEGITPSSIASSVGCSRALVYKYLHRYGVPVHRDLPALLTDEQRARVLELHDLGLTHNEVAGAVGVTYHQVRRLTRKQTTS